jgi:hypothetical protein
MPVDPNHAFTFGQMVIINRGGTPATLKAAAGMTEEDVGGRLAVAHSDFRVMSLWGVVPPGGGGSIGALRQASEAGPFADAGAWLNQGRSPS